MKLFFSYPHDANAPLVERLKADLEARGHEVWFDADRIKEGDEWRARITRGILDSQRVVAFLSRHSVRDPGVCLNEIGIALAVKGDEAIVTVLVEPEQDVSAPLSITHIQFMRMEDWAARYAQGGDQWEGWYRTRLDKLADVIADARNLERDEQLDTLRRALVPQSFRADIARHLARFTGRRWMLDEYEHWLVDKPDSRVLRIVGGPGLGKTAIACYLGHATKSSVVGLVLCKYNDPSTRDPIAVVKTLAYQLATRLPDYRARLLREPLLTAPPPTEPAQARDYAHTLFTGLISNLLVDQPARQRLVIVIDGLDEATEHSEAGARNPIVQLMARELERLPKWIGVVLTGRPEEEITGALERYQPFKLDGNDPSNREDLRAYCEHWLAHAPEAARLTAAQRASLAQALLDRADGSFMYLVMAEEAARDDPEFLSDPAQLPVGLPGFYRHLLERRFPDTARPDSRYKKQVRPLMELLLASPVALPLPLARAVLNWDDYAQRDVLAWCDSLLLRVPGPEGETPQLTFFHQSVREWLGGRESAGVYMASPSRQAAPLAKAAWARYLASDKRSPYCFEALPELFSTLTADQRDIVLGPASQKTALALAAAAEAQRAAMRYTQCLALITLAVAMHETLPGLNNDAKTQRNMAISLNRLGDTISTLDRPHEAMPYYERSLELREALLKRAPNSGEAQRGVSVSLIKLGDTLRTLDRPHEALQYCERSLELSEALLQRAPDSAEAQRDVSVSLVGVGDILRTLDRPKEALPHYQRSLKLSEALLPRAPDSSLAQHDVSLSLDRLGATVSKLGRPNEAMPYYERSLELREGLLKCAPDSGDAQRDMATALDRLGDTLGVLKRTHEALPYYERSLDLREALLQRAPDSAEAQRHASLSLDRLGYTLGTLDRPDEALPYYERSLDLREALLQRAPDSAEAQRDTSLTLDRLADTLGTLNRPDEALPYYQRSLELRQALLQRAPDSGVARHNVAVSLSKLWWGDKVDKAKWGRLLLRHLLAMQTAGTSLDDSLMKHLHEQYGPLDGCIDTQA